MLIFLISKLANDCSRLQAVSALKSWLYFGNKLKRRRRYYRTPTGSHIIFFCRLCTIVDDIA